MTKKLKQWLILLFVLIGAMARPRPGQTQSKSYYWERSDVFITLHENGDMDFVEEHTLVFSGDPFTFGFREIPSGAPNNFVNNDGLSHITISEGDRQFVESDSQAPGTFFITDNNIYQTLYWYFEPALGSHTYTIGYTVKGGIIVNPNGDQLFWQAIPYDHAAPIQNGSVTIFLPEGVRPQTITGTDTPLVTSYVSGREGEKSQFSLNENGQMVQFILTEPLAEYQEWEIRVQFPHGLPIPVSNWQQREQRVETIRLLWPVLALFILVAGEIAILLLWFLRGRDPDPGPLPAYITEPPDTLSPAVVGSLIDERVNMQDILAILVDLARRGYLTITQTKQDFSFERREKAADDLRPFEQRFLELVFMGREKITPLSQLHYRFVVQLPEMRRMLDNELEQQGVVRRSPEVVRRQYRIASLGLGGLALAAYPFSSHYLEQFYVYSYGFFPAGWLTLVLLIVAGTLFYVSNHMPVKTAKGALATKAWLAFRRYLEEIEQKRDLQEVAELFERFLPYAVAFGFDRQWINKFAQVKSTPMPLWYQIALPRPEPPQTSGPSLLTPTTTLSGDPTPLPSPAGLESMSAGLSSGLQSMSESLTRMLTSTATILKTPPAGSSGRSSYRSTFSSSSSSHSSSFSSGRSGGGGRIGFG